jgi:hypothetical protein
MNGRIYDPSLGRMLSPDPVTQAPEHGQNYNRYSYAYNNPLRHIDPSGFQVEEVRVTARNLSGGGNGSSMGWSFGRSVGSASLLGGQFADDPGAYDSQSWRSTGAEDELGLETPSKKVGDQTDDSKRAVKCINLAGGSCIATVDGVRVIAQRPHDRPDQIRRYPSADASKSNPTLTGYADAGVQVFGGFFGASVSTGLTADTLNPNACSVTTTCIQFGLGIFAGVGGGFGGGLSTEAIRSGTGETFGIFGNIGAFGTAAGGSLTFGGGSAGGVKAFLGVGKGVSGGAQFCRSFLNCLRN